MLWTNLLASRSTTIGWHCCTYQDNPRSENISLRHLLLPPWPAAHSGSSRSAHHGSPRNQLCSRHDFLNLDVWFDGSSSTSCRSCMWVISILLSLMKSPMYVFNDSHLFPEFWDLLHWLITIMAQALSLLSGLKDRRLVHAVGKSGILLLNLFCSFLPFTPFSMSSSSLTSIYIIFPDQDL